MSCSDCMEGPTYTNTMKGESFCWKHYLESWGLKTVEDSREKE